MEDCFTYLSMPKDRGDPTLIQIASIISSLKITVQSVESPTENITSWKDIINSLVNIPKQIFVIFK